MAFPSELLPSPTEGWSRDVTLVRRAVVVPATESEFVQACGVQDASGAFVPASATWRGKRPLMVPPEAPVRPVDRLAGRHLWGGQLWAHFGHFMVESLARIWAYDHADKPDGLVFIAKRPGKVQSTHGYQREFLELLGVDVPITILTEPTEIDELIVPGQGFGLGTLDTGTPEFRGFFAGHFARDIAPDGPERLYLSRSALGGAEGGVILEDVLEHNLAREGYEILHPQKHSIARQVAYYKAAKQVVGPDGSAFHLFGFVARPDQRAAVILRRSTSVYKGLKNQIQAFTGREPEVVSAINADWIPEHKNRPGRFSFGQLDFARVGEALRDKGYIAHPEAWDIPNFRRQKRAMETYAAGKNMTFHRRKTKADTAADTVTHADDDS